MRSHVFKFSSRWFSWFWLSLRFLADYVILISSNSCYSICSCSRRYSNGFVNSILIPWVFILAIVLSILTHWSRSARVGAYNSYSLSVNRIIKGYNQPHYFTDLCNNLDINDLARLSSRSFIFSSTSVSSRILQAIKCDWRCFLWKVLSVFFS